MKHHHPLVPSLATTALAIAWIFSAPPTAVVSFAGEARSAESAVAAAPVVVSVAPVKIQESVKRSATHENLGGALDTFAKLLGQRLGAQLAASHKFKLVPRSSPNPAPCKPDKAVIQNAKPCAVAAAQHSKASTTGNLLQISITEFWDPTPQNRAQTEGQGAAPHTIRALVSANLVDAATGVIAEVLPIPPITLENLARFRLSAGTDDAAGDDPIPALATLAANLIFWRLTDVYHPAKVLSVARNGAIFVNRGAGTGITAESVWDLYATGEPLVDPDTGENLGKEEVFCGRIVITSVGLKFSRAMRLESHEFENLRRLPIVKGQTLRLVSTPE
ncbi:MAG: hypothetical protein LBG65_00275 [Puniceicoccales bacterium]|jgi:hypothetical protein|nr:hypothetical protein [Puniceicoccales bacterium]